MHRGTGAGRGRARAACRHRLRRFRRRGEPLQCAARPAALGRDRACLRATAPSAASRGRRASPAPGGGARSTTECTSARTIPSPAAAAASAAAWLVYATVSADSRRLRSKKRPTPSERSTSGGPISQRSPAERREWDVAARGERMGRRRDDDQPAAQERHGCDGRRLSGPGRGPKAMSARRCSSRSANDSPGTASTAISIPASRPANA